jgi:UDP-N-acetylmuramoylalanine--D-glutamate ligase
MSALEGNLFDGSRRWSVVGAARSGIAAANFLARIGADVLLSDVKGSDELGSVQARLHPAVKLVVGSNIVRQGDVVVISPGVKPHSDTFGMCQRVGAAVISEVELFARWHRGPMVAITGTDGKSTTTKLVGDLLRDGGLPVFVGGNIGNALCEALPELAPDTWVVAEISNAQLMTIDRFRPRIALITNIAEDHVDYHGSMEAYQAAKRRVWENQQAGDTLILNADNAFMQRWQVVTPATVERFSPQGRPGHEAHFADQAVFLGGERLLGWEEFPIPGSQNVENVLCGVLAAHAAGVPRESIRRTLLAFQGLTHRMEFVRELDGVRYYNDSKATNPHAAIAGIQDHPRPFVLLAGGSEKGSDFAEFGDVLARKARAVILMGPPAERIQAAIQGRVPVLRAATLAEALGLARGLARAGDSVILSPACASFNEFRNFEHRGDTFKQLVGNL